MKKIIVDANTCKKEIGQNLRKIRLAHGKSQAAIANYIGTTQQVYSRYEIGENEIPVRHVIALSRYYRMSTDKLLGLK